MIMSELLVSKIQILFNTSMLISNPYKKTDLLGNGKLIASIGGIKYKLVFDHGILLCIK